MASGGRVERGSRPRARAASVVVPFPRRDPGDRLDLVRLVPSGRSLLLAFAILGSALLAWLLARETGIFGVRTIDVTGARPAVSVQVQKALRSATGTSLLKIDVAAAERAVESLPTVESASFDRAFPHTLRVAVVLERPVAVVRQGADSYLVAASGRVIAGVRRTARRDLARIWVPKDVGLSVGAHVAGDLGTAVDAVSPLAGSRFPGRVTSVTTTASELTMRLRSGLELRLGDPRDAGLKLAVAAQVIPLLASDVRYLDVSVPDRPVSGTRDGQADQITQPQVEVQNSPSTTP